MPSFKLSMLKALVIGAVLASAYPIRRDKPLIEFNCDDAEIGSTVLYEHSCYIEQQGHRILRSRGDSEFRCEAAEPGTDVWYDNGCDSAQEMEPRTFGSVCSDGCNNVNPDISETSAALPLVAKGADNAAHAYSDDTGGFIDENRAIPATNNTGSTCNGGCNDVNPAVAGASEALPEIVKGTDDTTHTSLNHTNNAVDESNAAPAANELLNSTNQVPYPDTYSHSKNGVVNDMNAALDPADCEYPSAADAAADLNQGAIDAVNTANEDPTIQPYIPGPADSFIENPVSLDTSDEALPANDSIIHPSSSDGSFQQTADGGESLVNEAVDTSKAMTSPSRSDSNNVNAANDILDCDEDTVTQGVDNSEVVNNGVWATEMPARRWKGSESELKV